MNGIEKLKSNQPRDFDLSEYVEIRRVTESSDLAQWLDLGKLVKPSRFERKLALRRLDLTQNPFFLRASRVLFLAKRAGNPVGRVAAVVQDSLDGLGQRSSLDIEALAVDGDDGVVLRELLKSVEDWGRSEGVERIRGPRISFPGPRLMGDVSIEQTPFSILNVAPCKPDFIDLSPFGFKRERSYGRFEIDLAKHRLPDRILAQAARLRSRSDIEVGSIRFGRKRTPADTEACLMLASFQLSFKNSGYLSLPSAGGNRAASGTASIYAEGTSVAEAHFEISELSRNFDSRFAFRVKIDGKVVAALLAIPEAHGSQSSRSLVLQALSIRPGFRRRALTPLLWVELYRRALEEGFESVRIEGVPDDNAALRRTLSRLKAVEVGQYSIFEKQILA